MNIVGEMRSCLGEDYAILKFSESRESFSIDIVSVRFAHRGQGIGAELITHILQPADTAGKNAHVAAGPIGSYDEDKLQRPHNSVRSRSSIRPGAVSCADT
jgi:predicted GNAT family acetyltransferase